MVPALREHSLADMQHKTDGAVPTEYNNPDYGREVLQLSNDQTENLVDDALIKEAEAYGITVSATALARNDNGMDNAVSESVDSRPTKTASSITSQGSHSTGRTSRSSHDNQDLLVGPQSKRRSPPRRSLSFSEYDSYLLQEEAQTLARQVSLPTLVESTPSLLSARPRKSFAKIKEGIKSTFRLRRVSSAAANITSCICCRDEFNQSELLLALPCMHKYCDACLRVLVTHAMDDEAKMPPRCCTQPIPGNAIKTVLTRDDQYMFMKSVVQFSTPWEARIFCPNPTCGEFIPRRKKIDPKLPFDVVCPNCRTRACSTCRRPAHAFGKNCPVDWELDAVLKMGEKYGWKRCYKCRNLVELSQGCSHITCRCKAQFCYICGAVWDGVIGCPNFCNGEEELERRRLEEEARMEELEKEKLAREQTERLEAAGRDAAERRTSECEELGALRARQIDERDRFSSFERKMKWMMWTRHGQSKSDLLGKHKDTLAKMKERHLRTSSHLEDRQVATEMELRASHKQAERTVMIRLHHMEAYCDGIGRDAIGSNPARVVTERDLRELGAQYNLRDGLEHLHQSKINVMRDKQTKLMEQLIIRQEDELKRLSTKHEGQLDALESRFVNEEDGLFTIFQERRLRLKFRWNLTEEILRKKLEARNNVKYAPITPVEWDEQIQDDGPENPLT
ncbi:hypothetical protein BJ875DRAFT_252408 [Amylocarpus encephaloides]|uniref:RBR-type E3 ubiquitin transferase n=1 Tax=Amylocarpus encephaloides TaxID=45428 RepID=A0A9P8BZ06_9HELO|nr:hypothetical protein BJ875DRAFT_252408 [Amylocarpus encephaloides]